jgi:hypothetical protein
MACPGTIWGYTLPPATTPSFYIINTSARDDWKAFDSTTGTVIPLFPGGLPPMGKITLGQVVVDFTEDSKCSGGSYVSGGPPCVYQLNPSSVTTGFALYGDPGVYPDLLSSGLDPSVGSMCCGTTVKDKGSCPIQHNQFTDLPLNITKVVVQQPLNATGKFFAIVVNAEGLNYSKPVTYELADGASTIVHQFENPPGTPYTLKIDFGGSGAAAKFPAQTDLTLAADRGASYTVGSPVKFDDFSQSGLPVSAGRDLCCSFSPSLRGGAAAGAPSGASSFFSMPSASASDAILYAAVGLVVVLVLYLAYRGFITASHADGLQAPL